MSKINNTFQIIKDFNFILLDLFKNIADVCPNSLIGKNIKFIEKTIINASKNDKNTKFINIFVEKVLQYKSEIDKGNEDFFLKKSYKNDLDDQTSSMDSVFEFKNIWTKLNRNNKDLVIQYMQILCELAQKYFILVDKV